MAVESTDLVVVGLGPGGEEVVSSTAQAGLSVVGVNAGLVGGECPYYACVPTKMMVRAATALAEARRVPELAGTSEVTPDWALVADRIREEATTDWDDTAAARRIEDVGARLVRGRGWISGPGEVTVASGDGQRVFRPRRGIVLNPGTEPAVPPLEGLAGTPYWTNREAVRTREVPRSLIVLGGGPVGVEFAQVFARFGAEVTVVETRPRLLSGGEPEASESIESVLRSEGVGLRLGTAATRVRYDDGRFSLDLRSGESLSSTHVLVATGRTTDLAALGVGTVGLAENTRTIPVDEWMRAAEDVWAIGDVTGHGGFTHTSVYQAQIAVADILGRDADPADYRASPVATFTDPEVAAVGLTESAARDRGIAVRTAMSSIPASARGWIHKAGNDGLIKLIVDSDRGVLVGATVVAPTGGEVMGVLAVAVHGEVPLRRLRNMIFAYPTFHRAIEPALRELVDSGNAGG